MSVESSTRSSRGQPAVDSTVTRLLVVIKSLLEALQQWSTGIKDGDIVVSNVYVQLGNEFNTAVAAFNACHIDMSDLASVPQELREVLEAALSNDASPSVLEVYLPQVRAIITNLLTGLRSKQGAYQEAMALRHERRSRGESMTNRRHERSSTASTSQSSRHTNSMRPSDARNSTAATASNLDEDSFSQSQASRRSQRTDSVDSVPALPLTNASDMPPRDMPPRYSSRTPTARGTPRTTPAPIPEESSPAVHPTDEQANVLPGYDPSDVTPQPVEKRHPPRDDVVRNGATSPDKAPRPGSPYGRKPRASSGNLAPSRSLPSSRAPVSEPPPMRRNQSQYPPSQSSQLSDRAPSPTPPVPVSNETEPSPPPPPVPSSPPVVPASIKRYSLSDNPVPQLPKLHLDETNISSDEFKESDLQDPNTSQAADSSSLIIADEAVSPSSATGSNVIEEGKLADLKRSELERRASKRYSAYTFNMLVGGSSLSERPNNRRSMLAPSSLLTTGDLDAVAEEDDGLGVGESSLMASMSIKPKRTTMRGRDKSYGDLTRKPTDTVRRAPSVKKTPTALPSSRSREPDQPKIIEDDEEVPPPPPSHDKPGYLTPTDASTAASQAPEASETAVSDSKPHSIPGTPPPIAVFLQIGRNVKKISLDVSQLSFSSLKLLFVDQFSYNPGTSNFPNIYIRDPSSGVQYELDNLDEIHDKCLLSLNVEPLDELKQLLETRLSTMSQEIKDLKKTVASNQRQSMQIPTTAVPVAATPTPDRPPDKQFASVAKRLTRVMSRPETLASLSASINGGSPFQPPPAAPLMPQVTGSSLVSDERASRMAEDLKTQFDEIQHLRRDMGAMRQIYVDFIKSTKESLGGLRTQTQNVRDLANAKAGSARAFIDAGKAKLDTRTQDILQRIDELQDTVEAVRDDVLKRRVSPKPAIVRALKADIANTATELRSLSEAIVTVKPTWKQTWEHELENIVEEQNFLQHQEGLIEDLLEDHRELAKVFERVEEVASHRGLRSASGPRFRPAPPEEGHDGLSTVMMELRGADVDPNKRLKAIEANQKLREKERLGQKDEFEEELSTFVDGKKLRRIGGAEEAERVRQVRNDMVMKAMFQTVPLSSFSK